MGWKTDAILINRPLGGSPDAFLQRVLGKPCTALRTVSLDVAFYPSATFVGESNGSSIILDPNWPGQIVHREEKSILAQLIATFPDADIAAVGLQSVVNYSGFRFIRAGQSIRAFAVASDDGVAIDEGDELPFEVRALSKYKRVPSKAPQRLYVDDQGEQWQIDQLGEELVFELFRDFFGGRPDFDDDLMEIEVTEISHAAAAEPAPEKKQSFWRKLLGGALVVS
jgi:hypothetical protein